MMPNLDQFYMLIFGGYGYDAGALTDRYLGLAAGMNTGAAAPPYAITDFLAMYPKFAGAPTSVQATLTAGSAVVPVDNIAMATLGNLVTGPGIVPGTVIIGVTAEPPAFTLSNPAAGTAVVALSVFTAPLVPLVMLQLYLMLATAGLSPSRWRGPSWYVGVGLYIAHFCTLWLQSEGNPQTTAGQIVANAAQTGLLVSESADGVSASFQPLQAVDAWAAWSTTTYGVQLVTMARSLGAGAVYFR